MTMTIQRVPASSAVPRRDILLGVTGLAVAGGLPTSALAATSESPQITTHRSGMITTKDGTQLYYKDWGKGPTVVLSHGWPLNADSWDDQALFLAEHGFRVIAHDRRGFGRSTQPWGGYDYDTFADDLEMLFRALDLKEVALFGFSMGGGEVARYVGRHGTSKLSKAGLIAAVPPLMLQTPNNSGGTPLTAFDSIRAGVRADRSQFFKDVSHAFFGANRKGAKVSQGTLDWFWFMAMQASIKGTLDCIKAFSETDFTEDLKKIDRPTMIIHGDDDQIVPIGAAGLASAKIVKKAALKVYPGAPHGLTITRKDQVNADILAFLKA
jgi:non-heme chloroperoxidase